MRPETPEQEIEAIICDCEEALNAARDTKAAIEARNAAGIRAGLKALDHHTDGYWNRLVLGQGTGEIHLLADELEEAQEVA